MNKKYNLYWLNNGLWALGLAGLYSIILVILRTPILSKFFVDKSLFKSALIVHVNLSMLVWLLSITSLIWSRTPKNLLFEPILNKLCFIGMILMAIAPFIGETNAIMNNYVPILENIYFIIGLSLFTTSLLFFAVIVFFTNIHAISKLTELLKYSITINLTTSFLYICVWVCIIISYFRIIYLSSIFPMDLEYFYELLFWSGGHLLQFIYTQIAMYVWLKLAQNMISKELKFRKIYVSLFYINIIAGLTIFFGHIFYQIPDHEFIYFFTTHMKYLGGAAATMFVLILLLEILHINKESSCEPAFVSTAFYASIIVFFIGGLMGIFISGTNLSIPAHYHGSIVGISIGFFGFSYLTLYEKKYFLKNWANIQLYIFTIGQIIHISGLALLGSYNVIRKNPNDIIPLSAKLYSSMMGIGGLIAIIGGLMFVYICAKRLYPIRNL